MSNRTSVQVGAGTPTTTSFDAANRPTSDSLGGTYTSDGDGRLTSQPNQRLAWDALGRLTTVYPATGLTPLATYTYDPLDRLRMVDYGGTNRVRFRYVGLTTSAAQTIDDQSGSVLRNIGTAWGGERQLDWTGTNSNIRYYGTNAHHDTVWTASSSGTVSATLRYDPWGTLTTSTGASLPDFRFQGSWLDTATSLQWVVTRWYAPALGRFISEDTLTGTPTDPPSRHLYAYGVGDPEGRIDRDGRDSYKTINFNNFGHLRGKLVLALFIQKRYNLAPNEDLGPFRLYGDDRGYSDWAPPCGRSRACITINFDVGQIYARVHNSCGDVRYPFEEDAIYIGYGCSPQFPIVNTAFWQSNDEYNLLKVSNTSDRLALTWDFTQSRIWIIRPDFTVNGSMSISYALQIPEVPGIKYHGDGFPSEELYWFGHPTRTGYTTRRTLFHHDEGKYNRMNVGLGDWSFSHRLPQS
jgi:RHS repeat-associated protein